MRSFEFTNCLSLRETSNLFSRFTGRSKFYAGGTDLLGTIKDHIHPQPVVSLINIKQIKELGGIRESNSELRIGASVTVHELAENKKIQEQFPGLAEAAKSVASPQLRRMGTVGGNICQEPRCWYYRYPDNYFYCLRKGGSVCNAIIGENQFHSIFGSLRVEKSPCSRECPNAAHIPEQLSLIRQGDVDLAARKLLNRNPLPAVTGRVCPRYCERACARSEVDDAVAIGSVERALGDMVLARSEEFFAPPVTEVDTRIAVVGSGPGGLSAAYYLRRQGAKVHIFDNRDKAGGMLSYSLPAYRLPEEVVVKVVKALESMGIEFNLGRRVDSEMLHRLRHDYHSVILATGAWSPVSIGFGGEEKAISALDFLSGARSGAIISVNLNVVVVGGGNVAVDAAVIAKRLGADRVIMACLESRTEMPADESEIQLMLEEGVDLRNGWGPSRLLESEGIVMGLEMVKCLSVFDRNGTFSPRYKESVRETFKADQVILAVGQKPEPDYLINELGGATSRVWVDPFTQETKLVGVYACGDMVTGPATVAKALAAGRKAAMEIGKRLGLDQNDLLDSEERHDSVVFCETFGRLDIRRNSESLKPPEHRTTSDEDKSGLLEEQVLKEAERCLNCGCIAVSPTDIGPAFIAHKAIIVTSKRQIKAEKFFSAAVMQSTVLDPDELVLEMIIPKMEPGTTGSAYAKFRVRNAIDFAIAAAYAWVQMADGVVQEARICLGAVAPVPLLVQDVGDYLQGKELTEQTAEKAAEMAVSKARPLSRNAAKVQITKSMVKRALLAAVKRCGEQLDINL